MRARFICFTVGEGYEDLVLLKMVEGFSRFSCGSDMFHFQNTCKDLPRGWKMGTKLEKREKEGLRKFSEPRE